MNPIEVNGHMVYHMVDEADNTLRTGVPSRGGSVSILNDVKLFCNLTQEYKAFDEDIIALINGVLSVLVQLGVISPSAPLVMDDQLTWSEWIPDEARFGMVKLYLKMKVRLMFDPPASSDHRQAMQDYIDEMEWRGFFEADTPLYQ